MPRNDRSRGGVIAQMPLDDLVGVTSFLGEGMDLVIGIVGLVWVGPDPASRPPVVGNGIIFIILISLLGATSILPSLVNALTLICLIVARMSAGILGPPVRFLQSLIAEDEAETGRVSELALRRSTAIYGGIGMFLILALYGLFYLGRALVSAT